MVLIMKFTTNNAEDRMTEHKEPKEIVCTPEVQSIQGTPQAAIQAPPQLHPFIERALETGQLDVDSMKKLMDMQFEWEANGARKAFTEALVALKAELPTAIEHDKSVSYDGGKTTAFTFTSMAKAMDVCQPLLSKYGFSSGWISKTLENGDIHVVCRLTHIRGHFDESELSAAPDRSGKKNAIQAVGSTKTYLERYTFLGLLGITTRDMKDTDQHAADDASSQVDHKKNAEAIAYIESKGLPLEEAERHIGRSSKEWTAADLDTLRGLIKERGLNKKQEVSIVQPQDAVVVAAKKLWGSDWFDELDHMLKEEHYPPIDELGRDGLQFALTEINDRLDAINNEKE